MIQLNLLPDIKLEYIKSQRLKRTVILLSTVVSVSALTVFFLFFTVVNVVQREHLSNLDSDIQENKKALEAKPDLSKILTIQNQLESLPALHAKKPVASRAFGFMQQVTPQKASMSSLEISYADNKIDIEGTADSLTTVNTFVDTLKFTNYTAEDGSVPANTKAFSEVVLTNFSMSTGQAATNGSPDKAATYHISLKYDPAIFSADKKVKLVVTSKVTTRSETEKPTALFQNKPEQTQGTGQ